MKKLTIAVTVYNSEFYIENTLNSIISNLTDDVEVLVLNDGSTDKSLSICRRFANESVRIITVENGGVSKARNTIIDLCNTEYVWFIDGDDRIKDGSVLLVLRELYKSSPEIVMANYYSVLEDTVKKREELNNGLIGEAKNKFGIELLHFLLSNGVSWCVWKNIYSIAFLRKNKLYFDEKLRMNEDGNWFFEVILKARIVNYILDGIYLYTESNMGSITKTTQSYVKYSNSNYVYNRWFNIFDSMSQNGDHYSGKLKVFAANGYMNAASTVFDIPLLEERKRAVELFEESKRIAQFSDNKPGRLFVLLNRFFSVNVSLKVINVVKRIKNYLRGK